MRMWSVVLVVLALFISGPLAAQSSVSCESRDGGYRECYSGFRGPPVLVRQLSNSSCVEGRSWGHRPGSIWVSQGCRGIFEEGRGGGHGGDGIVCESRDNRYNECPLRSGGPVELVEQYSGSSCIEGRSWGRKRGVIWVDRGCRGLFAPYYGGGRNDYDGGGYWEQQGDFTIQCESKDNRYRTCSWDWNAGTPYLLDQLSNNPCVKGRSWGYDARQQVLWVDQGCRAVFGGR